MGDRLNPGEVLPVDSSLISQNGRFTLILQRDGNLVLYKDGSAYMWDSNTFGPVTVGLMQDTDGNFVIYQPDGNALWGTGTDVNPGAYLVVQDDGNVVIYDSAGNGLWATNTVVEWRVVSGFLPSTSALNFVNSFPNASTTPVTISPLGITIPLHLAANGLCGGMGFAARDYYEAGRMPPPDPVAPSSGPLFDYLVSRQISSIILPPGAPKYIELMNPTVSDHETLFGQGRAWIMIREEWPKIRAELDNDHPCPLGLVLTESANPFDVGKHHQVLAYGYELFQNKLQIRVYDPNEPNDDNVVISLNIARPRNTTPVSYSHSLPGSGRIICFFRQTYSFVSPP